MKLVQSYSIAILASLILINSGCSSNDDEVLPGFDNSSPVLDAGAMIPMRTKVAIITSGTYLLPPEAGLLTTRCYGSVSVTLQQPNQSPQVNSCNSATGSSSQTNNVSGLTDVNFNVAAGSRAEVTLN
ncbi:MAG: hypothetical protein DHS20C17_21620 [Cyclobacteriaceae bacterium]|nr:MAG: hypothetical protein DHS20C17_21620 [Cyclobacteriaceae bacterium]